MFRGARRPVQAQPVDRHVLLGATGLQCGDLRRRRRAAAVRSHVLEDLRPPLREVLDHRPRHTAHIRHALLDRVPGKAEALGQLAPQHRLIQAAGGLGLAVEMAAIERRPAPVRPAREIPHETCV